MCLIVTQNAFRILRQNPDADREYDSSRQTNSDIDSNITPALNSLRSLLVQSMDMVKFAFGASDFSGF